MTSPPRPNTRDVFEALYREHFTAVWRHLHRLGVRGGELDELTQDVFLVAFRRLHTFDASRRMRPWLLGIATHVALDSSRLHHRKHEVHGDADAPSSANPEAALADQQERTVLARALLEVDADKRAVLALHDLEGLTMVEIADQIPSPLPTLYSRLRTGRQQLVAAAQRLKGERPS